eukprot:TRINITY_DN212_c2_g1_i1.p1 TRINITY_DN212_c2_g1~~TRINITY_DN212_c2_g1_i1.p1  ORF type:complete len:207 (-),score=48.37 TRINITY_DN212_c2_g1_i1:141-761(-)
MSENPLAYNGSSIVAMAGRGCVAIASDTRYGIRQQTLSTGMRKTFSVTPHTYVGFSGLATDMETVRTRLRHHINLFTLKEEREMKPKMISNLLASMLYEKRFGPYFVEPVICGLDESGKPFLSAMDLIGAPVYTDDFVVAGTNVESLYGMCETLFRPDLGPDELFETISQCLLASIDRDCLSGWGCVVHVITLDGVTTRTVRTRMD